MGMDGFSGFSGRVFHARVSFFFFRLQKKKSCVPFALVAVSPPFLFFKRASMAPAGFFFFLFLFLLFIYFIYSSHRHLFSPHLTKKTHTHHRFLIDVYKKRRMGGWVVGGGWVVARHAYPTPRGVHRSPASQPTNQPTSKALGSSVYYLCIGNDLIELN